MAVLQQRVDAIYGAVDANKDGYLETEEIYEWLRTAKAAGWARQVSYSWIMQVAATTPILAQHPPHHPRPSPILAYLSATSSGR